MAKNKGVMNAKFVFDLVFAFVMIGFLAFLAFLVYIAIGARGSLTSYSLPQRILPMPIPEQIVNSLETTDYGVTIYAKEPLHLEGLGTYTVGGYLKASKSLNSAIAIYRRTKDPANDPACKVLTLSPQSQSEVLRSSVYVCEQGQSDVLVKIAEFTNTKFASFCFPPSATIGVNGHSVFFWIGVGWDPFLTHPLTLLFDNLTAINVSLPFALASPRFPPCADPSSW